MFDTYHMSRVKCPPGIGPKTLGLDLTEQKIPYIIKKNKNRPSLPIRGASIKEANVKIHKRPSSNLSFFFFFFPVFVRKQLPNYHANKLNPKKVRAPHKSLPYISFILLQQTPLPNSYEFKSKQTGLEYPCTIFTPFIWD